MTAEFQSSAIAQFAFAPTASGWDWANLRVISNAENFPTLDIFVLGIGRLVSEASPDSTWDPGPKPAEAFSPGGQELCP